MILAAVVSVFVLAIVAPGLHRIGRIAYLVGVALWDGTIKDERKGFIPQMPACLSVKSASSPIWMRPRSSRILKKKSVKAMTSRRP